MLPWPSHRDHRGHHEPFSPITATEDHAKRIPQVPSTVVLLDGSMARQDGEGATGVGE